MKKCNHCGADVPEEESVCPACGQEVTEETASAEEPTEQTASEETAAQTDPEADSFTCEEEPETDGVEQTEDEASASGDEPQETAPEKKKPSALVWVIGALAVVAIVSAIFLAGKKSAAKLDADAPAENGVTETTDENGNVLPEFEKVLDIDIKAAAEKVLGKTLDQNLLSVVFDYDGNLWFATGGFRIYPDRKQQGAVGYISRNVIDAILNGEEADLTDSVFVYELTPGEGAENGIASSKDGAVILTNLNCYLFRADNGVQKVWETPYESVGAKESKEGDATTGGGLAWGSGCSPSLTDDLVMFTDNQNPVNLLAVDMKTGETVASLPVIDELPEDTQISVENSAIVYDNGEGTVSTIVCNWFGAGSADLGKEDSDSSIQSYANIYDVNWLSQGNKMIMPGVERVDTIKTDNGYEMKSIWCRSDLSDTSMMKLSTATGYIYGYVQNLETGMWQYIMLDFETGETVFAMDVSSKPGYNNMAIGMYAGNSGNALYCPTGYLELLRLQDRFVYLPEMPYRKVDLDQAMRNVLSQEKFEADGGQGSVSGWLSTVTVENVHPNTTVALRMKDLSGSADALKLYGYDADGTLKEVPKDLWHIQTESGEIPDSLSEDVLYEVHVLVQDGGTFDLSENEKEIKISVVPAQ